MACRVGFLNPTDYFWQFHILSLIVNVIQRLYIGTYSQCFWGDEVTNKSREKLMPMLIAKCLANQRRDIIGKKYTTRSIYVSPSLGLHICILILQRLISRGQKEVSRNLNTVPQVSNKRCRYLNEAFNYKQNIFYTLNIIQHDF